ncbi:MAG: nucleotidyltransferase [Planctomycetota bacterium]
MEEVLLSPEFLEFLKCLNDEKVEYLLIGGYAVNLHGYARATGDMDVWVAMKQSNAEAIIRAFDRYGFDIDGMDLSIFTNPRSIVRFGDPPMKVEVVTSIEGVDFDRCKNNADQFEAAGVLIPVIGLKDLRTNKAASGRPKDLVDLEHLPNPDQTPD